MKINILMTVDWEGRCLEEENLRAMELYNRSFSYIPTLHFMNAAYFTKNLNNAEHRIKKALKPNDLFGLHIHCWRSLVHEANLDFRTKPSFVYEDGIPEEELLKEDCGHDLSLSAYDKNEVKKLIEVSETILKKYHLLNKPYFRAGGWVANRDLISAIEDKGYTYDFSALPPELMKGKRKNEALFNLIDPLWKDITPLTRPYRIGKKVVEIPNNACLADYMNSRQFLDVFIKLCNGSTEDQIFVMGFHQETAHKYIDHVMGAISLIEAEAKERNIEISYDFDFLEPSHRAEANQTSKNNSPLNA